MSHCEVRIDMLAEIAPAPTRTYNAHFRCFRGCPGEYSVYEVMYTCPRCGGLLEVHHDIEALRDRSAEEWKALLERRAGTTVWPYGSGVWGMREWVIPDLRDENIVSMYEGNTNLFWAERLGKDIGVPDLWVKLCGNSHTGSFKDLGMTVLVSVVKQMMASGKSPVRAVAAASTGDTSAALAAYAAAAGIPAIIFLPSGKVSTAQLIQPVANGAHVLALDTDFDGCMRIVKEVTQDNSIYLANSMNSIRIEGQKTVGIEIVRQFDWEVPDWIIIPVGNLGNISALYKGLKLIQDLGIIDRLPRLVAAQADKANPFYRSFLNGFREKVTIRADRTLASAIQIGDPVSYEKAVQAVVETNGLVEAVTEHELANAAARADLTGMYTCPHTGVALAALFKLVARGEIKSSDRVVVISTAHGLKFTSFKVGYHEGRLEEVESELANPPIYLPADVKVVKETIARRLQL
ncbi:MAG: threonine synthase [Caldilinea sp.]|jgi:threonine synthase|nr:MAG: threonine synthase [Caldilinea sp.]